MASVNKVIIIGHLGRDPEVRHSASGTAVCNLAVATSRKWKDKQSGEAKEETEWHRVVLYERRAEVAGEYLRKGSMVYIEGRLKTRKWTDKDGVEKYTTEIQGEDMKLMGRAGDGEGAAPAPQRQAQRTAAPAAAPRAAAPRSTGFDDMDSDIPFTSACPSFDMADMAQRRMKRYRGI